MEPINYMKLEIPAKSENESFARSTVAAFSFTLNPTLEEVNDIKTAVSEAVTNCVIHAYESSGKGTITITSRLYTDKIEIIICDTGKGIVDVKKAMEPYYTTGPEGVRSGMGFTMIKALMTSLIVESKLGVGTTVIMTKEFRSED
ncbi:MAG: anti-sigma F factor [Christensenellales bacterium]|jgi:stage II sporulation protein AB (anti-sigma F factor)